MTHTPPPCPECLRLGIEPRTRDRDRYLHPERYNPDGTPRKARA